jgi:death-on-curing protein
MDGPLFLTLDEVLLLHASRIERYGGTDGVRDMALLDSALAMPQSGFGGEYFHSDVPQMAAAYLYHIVCNHPFVDGNKRTGLAAAIVFLEMNHIDLVVDEDAEIDLTLRVAEGKATKDEVAEYFRAHIPSD